MKLKLREMSKANKILCECGHRLFYVFESSEKSKQGIVLNIQCCACHKMFLFDLEWGAKDEG